MEFLKKQYLNLLLPLFLAMLMLATLFPPFEWNFEHTMHGNPYTKYRSEYGSSSYYPYIVKNPPIKTYEFIFSYNQKKFYSDVTKKQEIFTRSIIFEELIVEYLLIIIVALMPYYVFNSRFRKAEL